MGNIEIPEAIRDEVLEEIGRTIADGNTSGQLSNGDGSTTAWELKGETWDDK